MGRAALVRLFAWLVAMQLSACADLPDVQLKECGNAIVEAGEDCDSFDPYGKDKPPVCRAPGKAGECHLDCTPDREGKRTECPKGWACDIDSVCRAPEGSFTALPRIAVGGIDSLASGDFDGDGRADLLSLTPHDVVRRASLAFHYFDARGNLTESRPLPISSTWPAIGKVSGDNRDDVTFNDQRLGVLLGRQDRTWVPETFTPYVLEDVSARSVGVADSQVSVRTSTGLLSSAPIVTLTTLEEGKGLYIPIPDDEEGQLTRGASLPGTAEQLVGDLVAANVLDDPSSPCREVLLAFGGATAFHVVDLCGVDAVTGLPSWRLDERHLSVSLEPPALIDSAPLAVDVDADGHLDVLISGAGVPYVALGDGRSLRTAVPYAPPAAEPAELGSPLGAPFVMPLAAGDFTGDGAIDFVMRDRLLVSWFQPGSRLPHYTSGFTNLSSPWTVAHIKDLNGNGHVDVVAAAKGSLNATFFSGTGTQNLIPAQISSGKPIAHLIVGDFDGDLLNDVSFVEASLDESEPDTLMVAYGALSRVPSAPVAVARVHNIEQIGRFGGYGLDTTSLVSARMVNGRLRSSLYFLGGSAVRIPLAPLELITFSPTGALTGVNGLAIALGAFTEPGRSDVIALVGAGDDNGPHGFWLVPSIDGESPRPEELKGTLSKGLLPSAAARDGIGYLRSKMYATSARADFDRDGRDDVAWAMPYDDPAPPDLLTSCGVESFSVTGGAAHELRSRGMITLDAPCIDPQLAAVDADLDGSADLVLLTGSEGGADRKLFILWNDRAGGFSSGAVTQVDTASAVPQAFAALDGTENIEKLTSVVTGRPFGLVFVTKTQLMIASTVQARVFTPPTLLHPGSLTKATSVVAADFNGDRAVDLAVADNGDLIIFNAKLSGS